MIIMIELTKEERKFFNHLTTLKPVINNGYFCYDFRKKRYKKSRVIMQLHLNKKLEYWELVHHIDGNKQNDSIKNLKVLNHSEHAETYHNNTGRKKLPPWCRAVNALSLEKIKRIKEIASGMVKINCSEISRRLEKEDISVNHVTVKKYLQKGKFFKL